jgi:hypothetical protein
VAAAASSAAAVVCCASLCICLLLLLLLLVICLLLLLVVVVVLLLLRRARRRAVSQLQEESWQGFTCCIRQQLRVKAGWCASPAHCTLDCRTRPTAQMHTAQHSTAERSVTPVSRQ